MYRSSTFIVKFFVDILFFFDATDNDIVLLISLSDSWSVLHGNATDFCILVFILQLYWICLLVLTVFWVVFRILIYNIMWYVNSDSCISSFFTWMPFISFSCVIALLLGIPMLNISDESGQSCFIPNLRRKAFSFLALNMVLAVGSM